MPKTILKPLFPQSPPLDLRGTFSDYACVSIVLKSTAMSNFELAYIRRATNPNDPWSGHVAFPGGRREELDSGDLATAMRETKEEVGWDLAQQHFLGYLTDIQARNRTGPVPFFLRPLVFHVDFPTPLNSINPDEVDEVFWIPVQHLVDKKNQTRLSLPDRGAEFPGIKFPAGDTLWGLTYLITLELLATLKKIELGRAEP